MTMPSLEVRLFATEPVVCREGELLSFSRRDALHLLIYLVAEQQDVYDRSKLAKLFFDKAGTEEDKQYNRLRAAVFQLRKVLGDTLIPLEAGTDSKKLIFNQKAVWLDTAVFVQRAQAVLNAGDQTPAFAREAEQTLALYRDHFLYHYDLGGSDEVLLWQEAQQTKLAELRHRLLEQIVRHAIKQGNLAGAQTYADVWLSSLEPGALPLQYLLWLGLKRRHYTSFDKHLAALQAFEAADAVRFGYSVAEWRRFIESGEDLLPSLLNLPTGTVGNSAPMALEGLVGRDEMLNELTRLLIEADQPRVMGVTGLPGVGKSVFARQLVYQLSLQKPKYDIARIELNRESDFELLLNDVLNQLGMDALVAQPYTSKQRRLKQVLQVRPCLILVDEGLSHRLSSERFLGSLLELFDGARLLLLARRLPEVEFYAFELLGLKNAEVGAFLAYYVPGLSSSLSESQLEAFARTSGGLPLVLQLVTGFLRDKRFSSIVSFTRALSNLSTEAWNAANAPYLYDRLLDWFWQLLTQEEQHLVALVSLFDFASGASEQSVLEIATDALSLRAEVAGRKLDKLVELNLLQSRNQGDVARFSLHPVIYDYVQSHRTSQDQPEFAAIHRAYSRHMVEFVTTCREDFAQLHAQEDNVIRMFSTSLANASEPGLQAEIVTLLNLTYDYFDRRGLYIVAEQLLQAAQKVESVSDFDHIKLIFNLGQAAFKQGRMDVAEQQFCEAWGRAQACGFVELYGEILRDLGRVAMQKGKLDTAVEYLMQAQVHAAASGQPVIYAQIVANLGVIEDLRGEHERARTRFEDILEELKNHEADYETRAALEVAQFAENMLGLIAIKLEAFEVGEFHLQRSLNTARQLNNPERIARSYINLGVLNYHQSRFDAALEYFTQGIVVAEYIQHNDSVAWLTFNAGVIQTVKRQYFQARRMLLTALHQANDLGLNTLLPNICLWLGILYFELGQKEQAQKYFVTVLSRFALNPWLSAMSLFGIGLIARYEQDVLMLQDHEMARHQVFVALDAAHVRREQLPAVPRQELARAEKDFQRALEDIPELERFHIADSVWSWLIEGERLN
jgi:tetratricopeptide (TPR) repeat protein